MRTMKTTTMKMKRRLALFVAVIMALSLWTALPLQASAATSEQLFTDSKGIVYYIPTYNDGASPNAMIVSYGGSSTTELEIPSTVTASGVTHPVTLIAYGAFAASNLTSVTMPASITYICDSAFYNCSALTTVVFPDSSNFKTVERKAFYNCTSLNMTEDNLPTTVTTKGADIFGSDSSGITIGVEGSYRYSVSGGEATLWGYTANDATPSVPSIVGSNIPVTAIGVGTFYRRTNLTEIEIPEGVESIGANTFGDCVKLESIKIANSVKSIGDFVFYGSKQLATVTISATESSLTSIGDSVFTTCSSLASITIPNSVTSIGNSTFDRCTSLATVTISAAESSLTSIGTNVFFGCSSLVSITIPDSLESLPSIFNGCTNLATVTISANSNLTSIGDNAFYNLTSLKTLVIPGSVTSIGAKAFSGCTSLESSVSIPNIESIGDNAFQNCAKLPAVMILASNQLTSIGVDAFSGCALLASITIPNSVTSIGNYAFSGCVKLATVEISASSSLTSIGTQAFRNTMLTSITIPNSVTTIGDFAFSGCSDLSEVTMLSKTSTDVATNAFNSTAAGLKIWLYNANDGAKAITAGMKVIMIESIAVDDTETSSGLNTTDNTTGTLSVVYSPAEQTEVATAPPAVAWTSSNDDIATVADGAVTATTTVTGIAVITATITPHSGIEMKAEATVTVEPPVEAQKFDLTVTNGSGSGPFVEGAQITITAEDKPGQKFARWEIIGGTIGNPTDDRINFTMPANEVRITATYRWATPNAEIDYAAEELTNLIAGNYSFNGGESVSVSGAYPIADSWLGTDDFTIARLASDGVAVSEEQEIDIPARPIAPTGMSKTDQTAAGQNDGTITNVTTAMQYSSNGGSTWEDVLDTEITDLAPGNYQVRYIATDSAFASVATTLTIAAYVPPTPPTTYVVTVTNGSGSASYEEGATVTITANTPAEGKIFDRWTTSDVTLTDATSATTTFIMPDHAVAVTATYKDAAEPETYAVTVTNGTGSGNYAEGATINISANAAPSGKTFDTWTGGVTFANVNSASTSFTMPNRAVTVEATYKDATPVTDDNWAYEDGTWYLVDDGGEKLTGWQKVEDTWYYLASSGEMQTGWEHVGSNWYYLAGNGKMQTGWVYNGGKWYYLTTSGAMKTGWQKDKNAWYYLSGNGAMVTGKWFKDTDGSWYYLAGSGKMLTGKQTIGGKTYTFKANGVWVG